KSYYADKDNSKAATKIDNKSKAANSNIVHKKDKSKQALEKTLTNSQYKVQKFKQCFEYCRDNTF
ncbi:rotein, partial [Francisella tularensis subsp. holarctica]|nr:rotein [Francisella tularensis subsp. holarctica]